MCSALMFKSPWKIPAKVFSCGKDAGKRFTSLAKLATFKSDLEKRLPEVPTKGVL